MEQQEGAVGPMLTDLGCIQAGKDGEGKEEGMTLFLLGGGSKGNKDTGHGRGRRINGVQTPIPMLIPTREVACPPPLQLLMIGETLLLVDGSL